MRKLANIFWLGTKELRSFFRDLVLLGLVIYSFSLADHRPGAEQLPGSCTTPRSASSTRTIPNCRAASPARFCRPISSRRSRSRERDIDRLMNTGSYTFIIDIPPHFERDVLGGRKPAPAGQCRRDRHGAGGHRLRLRAADRPDRDRQFRHARRGRIRRRRSISTVARSPSTPMSTPPGSPASWASSTTSPCWRSFWPARRSCASASMARWTICW